MGRKPTYIDIDGMVAVASGTLDRVTHWAAVLSGAAVPCAVARPCCTEDFAELWVDSDAAGEARAALVAAGRSEEKLIW